MISQLYVIPCQACRGRCVGRRGVIDWKKKKSHFEVENYTSRHFELQLLGECRSKVLLLGTSQKRYVHGTNVDCVHFCFVFLNQRRKKKNVQAQEHSADSTLIRRKVEKQEWGRGSLTFSGKRFLARTFIRWTDVERK